MPTRLRGETALGDVLDAAFVKLIDTVLDHDRVAFLGFGGDLPTQRMLAGAVVEEDEQRFGARERTIRISRGSRDRHRQIKRHRVLAWAVSGLDFVIESLAGLTLHVVVDPGVREAMDQVTTVAVTPWTVSEFSV